MYTDYITPNIVVNDVKAINNSIYNILMTRRGSLPGKPRFGSELYKVIFSQIDPITESQVKTYVAQALSLYEPRISVQQIIIKSVPEFNRIVVDIYYNYRDQGIENSANFALSITQ